MVYYLKQKELHYWWCEDGGVVRSFEQVAFI